MKKILMKKFFFFLCTKMVNKFTKKNKEKLQKEERERYQNLSQEEKEKKHQYGQEQYKNLLQVEYRKFFSRMQEKTTI